MRIIKLKEFLKLPIGTLFMKYDHGDFYELSVKDDSMNNEDFFYTNLTSNIDSVSSKDRQEKLITAVKDGTTVFLDFNVIGRDGLYDDLQLFAIYETIDIDMLLEKINKCKKEAYGE